MSRRYRLDYDRSSLGAVRDLACLALFYGGLVRAKKCERFDAVLRDRGSGQLAGSWQLSPLVVRANSGVVCPKCS